MLCIKPLKIDIGEVACGQCLSCRIKKRKEWTGRIILEMRSHPVNLFITLTYAEEHLPPDANLDKRDLTLYLKRLRKNAGSFRYYACGEYGEKTDRPHYHICLFTETIFRPEKILSSWGKGHVSTSLLTPERAAYTARYVVKKLTGKAAESAEHAIPEFAVMSRRNALGYRYVERLALSYETAAGAAFLAQNGDVCTNFRVNNTIYPLGKFLLRNLRARLGIPTELSDRIALNPNAANNQPLPESILHLQNEALKYGTHQWNKQKRRFLERSQSL